MGLPHSEPVTSARKVKLAPTLAYVFVQLNGWVVLQSGALLIATVALSISDLAEPLVFAVMLGSKDEGLSVPARG